MGVFSGWGWTKWLGKLAPIFTALLAVGVWEFAELAAPGWAGVVAGMVTMVVQGVLALFPAK